MLRATTRICLIYLAAAQFLFADNTTPPNIIFILADDLGNDPDESENLAEQNPDKRDEPLTKILEWRKSNDVPLPPNAVIS
jgi:hypothetical protein